MAVGVAEAACDWHGNHGAQQINAGQPDGVADVEGQLWGNDGHEALIKQYAEVSGG